MSPEAEWDLFIADISGEELEIIRLIQGTRKLRYIRGSSIKDWIQVLNIYFSFKKKDEALDKARLYFFKKQIDLPYQIKKGWFIL